MPQTRNRLWNLTLALLLVCAILGLSAFLYSGWHKHTKLSSALCPFAGFEHGAFSPDTAQVVSIEPPSDWVWLSDLSGPLHPEFGSAGAVRGRAPPAL